MSDYSEAGAQPVEDAVVDDPPTEAEVLAAQEREYPEQAATRMQGRPAGAPADADENRTGTDPADHGPG